MGSSIVPHSIRTDGELRKFAEQLVGLLDWATQEETEGGADKRTLRQDLYKQICSSDPISRRPTYDKSAEMMSLRIMGRFELNRPLVPPNVKAEARDLIYRMSLAIAMKGKLSPKCEYDAQPTDLQEPGYIPPNSDNLKGFIGGRPSDSAFFNIIYRYVNGRAIADSRRIIDDYARAEGATWGKCEARAISP